MPDAVDTRPSTRKTSQVANRSRTDAMVKPPLYDYIIECAHLLNLGQWTVKISPQPPESADELATCQVTPGQQVAVIRLSQSIINADPDEQRSCVLHELLHIHLWGVGEVAEHVFPVLGTTAAGVFELVHDLAIERVVDALSLVLAPFFPLPPK